MNDLMSLGIHRLWKDHFVRSLDPGLNPILSSSPSSPSPLNILDIAGGTGDIAFRLLDHATQVHNDTTARVTVADINPSMLAAGRARLASSPYAPSHRLSFIEANAEHLTSVVPSASVDLYTVAFGVRNFTDIPAALAEAHRVLKPGGVFACLEFSKVTAAAPLLEWAYKRWSFGAIPLIGQVVAGDRDSYQYLVESIERFPDQATFADMIAAAGFEMPRAVNAGDAGGGWEDLSGGIACIHKGIKPVSGT
jgi:2-methoxy-6-polyprenyl-1,4-benzoquinol methylase